MQLSFKRVMACCQLSAFVCSLEIQSKTLRNVKKSTSKALFSLLRQLLDIDNSVNTAVKRETLCAAVNQKIQLFLLQTNCTLKSGNSILSCSLWTKIFISSTIFFSDFFAKKKSCTSNFKHVSRKQIPLLHSL